MRYLRSTLKMCCTIWLQFCLKTITNHSLSPSHTVCLSVCLSVCLPASLSVCLSACLSVCLSVCPKKEKQKHSLSVTPRGRVVGAAALAEGRGSACGFA